MPRVVAYFDSLPDRLPAMQRRYNALRPTVVWVSIENGSDAVDSALREIVVGFDRAVRDNGWSVIPVQPDGQERFPQIMWKALGADSAAFRMGRPLDATGTRFRLGVDLEPGRSYEFQLNTAHGRGFRSVPDGVPLAPYRIRFKTRGVNGGGR
jgi:hypothetical protein